MFHVEYSKVNLRRLGTLLTLFPSKIAIHDKVPIAAFASQGGLLVSTHVVCERLSVMHEPAGVVENLVQILQFTPILQYRIPPPPPKMKIVRNLGTLTFQLQIPPSPPKIEI